MKKMVSSGVITERSNEELFSLDTIGDKGILKKEQLHRNKKQKVLKVDEILNARSAVPALISRKREGDGRGILSDGIVPEKRLKKGWVSNRDVQKLKRIAYGGTEVAVDKKKFGNGLGMEMHDPWAEETTSIVPAGGKNDDHEGKFSFLEKKKEPKVPVTMKMAPISLSATGKALPAVKIPEGGISYNPRFEEWDELLRREGDKEVEAEKRRLKEEQEEQERLARIEKLDAEELARELAEVEKGDRSEEDDNESDESNDDELKGGFAKKRAVRKTRVQRNKEKRRKEQELLKLRLSQQRKQRQQLESLRAIKREIEAKENERLEALAIAADEAGNPEKAERLRKRKLGKAQYVLFFPSYLTPLPSPFFSFLFFFYFSNVKFNFLNYVVLLIYM